MHLGGSLLSDIGCNSGSKYTLHGEEDMFAWELWSSKYIFSLIEHGEYHSYFNIGNQEI